MISIMDLVGKTECNLFENNILTEESSIILHTDINIDTDIDTGVWWSYELKRKRLVVQVADVLLVVDGQAL